MVAREPRKSSNVASRLRRSRARKVWRNEYRTNGRTGLSDLWPSALVGEGYTVSEAEVPSRGSMAILLSGTSFQVQDNSSVAEKGRRRAASAAKKNVRRWLSQSS